MKLKNTTWWNQYKIITKKKSLLYWCCMSLRDVKHLREKRIYHKYW